MPCSFGTKAILWCLPPLESLPLPPLAAEPPLPCPHAVRVSSAARPRAAATLVFRVFLIGSLFRIGVCPRGATGSASRCSSGRGRWSGREQPPLAVVVLSHVPQP